jgi:hypothetical protein
MYGESILGKPWQTILRTGGKLEAGGLVARRFRALRLLRF